jgi:hypothetical protein
VETQETPALLAQRADLSEVLKRGLEPPDQLVEDILLAGLVHMLYGKAATGKTWILLWLVARLLEQGKKVAYFDAENGKRVIAERLKDLGVDRGKLRKLYYFPFPSLGLDKKSVAEYEEFLDVVRPDFVAFDSVAKFLGLSALEESSNDDFIKWCARYTLPATRRAVAVVLLDHTGWDDKHVRGASRKLDEVGVMWAVKCPVPFDRSTTSTVTLHKEKDREAWLPDKVRFSIGGAEEDGRIICKRTDQPIVEVEGDDRLTPKERVVVDTHREEIGSKGARYGKWRDAAKERGVSPATFARTVAKLVSLGMAYKTADETYFLTLPPDGGKNHETGENVLDEENTRQSHVVSRQSHETNENGGDRDGLIGLTPYTVETNETSPQSEVRNQPTQGNGHRESQAAHAAMRRLTTEEVQEVRRLMREGMEPAAARDIILRERNGVR